MPRHSKDQSSRPGIEMKEFNAQKNIELMKKPQSSPKYLVNAVPVFKYDFVRFQAVQK